MDSEKHLCGGFTLSVDGISIGFIEVTDKVLIEEFSKYGTFEYEDVYSYSEEQLKKLKFLLYNVYEVLKKYENKLLYFSDYGGSADFKAELYNLGNSFTKCTSYFELHYICGALNTLIELYYINRGRDLRVEYYVG